MGQTLSLFRSSFNESLRIEFRPERLIGEPGAVLLREIMGHTWIIEWLADRRRRSLKYEEVYAKAYDSIAEPRAGISANLRFYKDERLHQGRGRYERR